MDASDWSEWRKCTKFAGGEAENLHIQRWIMGSELLFLSMLHPINKNGTHPDTLCCLFDNTLGSSKIAMQNS